MRVFKIVLLVFVAAWLVAATFNFGPGNERIFYFVFDDPADRPEGNYGTVDPVFRGATYKIEDDVVLKRIGNDISRFEGCGIFDADNWSCPYADDIGEVGYAKGVFFEKFNTAAYPDLAADQIPKTQVSRFRYNVQNCIGTVEVRPIDGVIACLVVPFLS